jgi:hypothetical protein
MTTEKKALIKPHKHAQNMDFRSNDIMKKYQLVHEFFTKHGYFPRPYPTKFIHLTAESEETLKYSDYERVLANFWNNRQQSLKLNKITHPTELAEVKKLAAIYISNKKKKAGDK